MPSQTQFFASVADDVVDVSNIDANQFDSAINELKQQTGFLSGKKALELISNHVVDESSAKSVRNLAFALHDWVNESGADVAKLCEVLREAWSEDNAGTEKAFDEQRFDLCVNKLAGPFGAIKRQANATRVASMAGDRMENFSFVSDLRPVYRQPDRDEIEGFIPLTTLVINSQDANGSDRHMEVVVSLSELEAIIKDARQAESKIKQLVEFTKKSGVEIPVLDLTEMSSTESKTNE